MLWLHTVCRCVSMPAVVMTLQGHSWCRLLHVCCCRLQFGELPEQSVFAEEFCKSMSYFTRHSLTGGTTSLKVGDTMLCCR